MEVAVSYHKTPLWVMKNFDMKQLGHVYRKLHEVSENHVELQARMVWAVANGWKRPVPIEDAIGDLEKKGILVDG